MIGKFATSKAGHDKTKLYIIIKEDAEYVYLVDGELKPIEKPKKKSKKHIQIIKKIADEQMFVNSASVNETIKRTIKLYKQSLLRQQK